MCLHRRPSNMFYENYQFDLSSKIIFGYAVVSRRFPSLHSLCVHFMTPFSYIFIIHYYYSLTLFMCLFVMQFSHFYMYFFVCFFFFVRISDREATVMYANSWLYHYYSIQSKIQFGIPYEGPTRVQAATTPYMHHHHIHHTNHQHHHHHHSPTAVETSIGHPYVTSHHMSPYGYHSPVPQHQASPGLVNHYSNSTPQLNYHNAGEHYRPYAYRIDAQPVDYSSAIIATGELMSVPNGDANQTNENGSPPVKRRALARLEPLYIPDNQHDSSSDTSVGELHAFQSSAGDGGTAVLLTSVGPLRHSQTHIKAMHTNDAHDFMDQWNPSPPWSETTQKVPDIVQQELSPYLARTPPTPTSAPTPANSTNGAAFSFDWMPEQFVPSMDGTVSVGTFMPIENASTAVMPIQLPLQIAHWSTPPQPIDHKFYSLQPIVDRHSEDDTRGKFFFFFSFFSSILQFICFQWQIIKFKRHYNIIF